MSSNSKSSSDKDGSGKVEKLQEISSEIDDTDARLKRTNEQLKEFSSFVSRPLATSSPLYPQYPQFDIQQLKLLMPQEEARRPFSRSGDIFLKPLPATSHYRKPILTSHIGHYGWGSPPSPYDGCFPHPLTHCPFAQLYRSRSEPSAIGHDVDKLRNESQSSSSSSGKDEVGGILKKIRDEISTSSVVETDKDIKVLKKGISYFMEFLKDLPEASHSKGLSEISSKLIADCHKLTEGLKESAKETKVVQFELAPAEDSPTASIKDSSSVMDSSFRSKDQPYSLLSNESLPSLPVGLSSPSSSTSAPRMEWDSGADVGYLNIDMTKDKLSTIERVTLQGFAQIGNVEKKVVYKTSKGDRVLQRIPSDLSEREEIRPVPVLKDTGTNPDLDPPKPSKRNTSDSNTQTTDDSEVTLQPEGPSVDETNGMKIGLSPNRHQSSEFKNAQSGRAETTHKNVRVGKSGNSSKSRSHVSRERISKDQSGEGSSQKQEIHSSIPEGADDYFIENASDGRKKQSSKNKVVKRSPLKISSDQDSSPETKDQSTFVDTLGEEFGFRKLVTSGSSDRVDHTVISPRVKKLKKKKSLELSSRSKKIKEIIEIVQSFAQTDATERQVEEITIDHSFHQETSSKGRPISASSGSNATVVHKLNDSKNLVEKTVQTSHRACESKAVQAEECSVKQTSTKNTQASGELNSLPKHLSVLNISEMTGREIRTKASQFYGEAAANSLPRALTHVERVKRVTKKSVQSKKPNSSQNSNVEESSGSKVEDNSKEVSGRLTAELLRERHGTVDPSILQEKFFESQRREMMSRSTSMETPGGKLPTSAETSVKGSSPEIQSKLMVSQSTSMEPDGVLVSKSTSMERPEECTQSSQKVPPYLKTASHGMVSIGIQYSPKDEAKTTTAVNHPVIEQRDKEQRQLPREAWTDTLDSQASSTQTAHSWVHGGAPARESVVRPTRSFEYLPGDVYESSGNLREKLPSETSQNVITESSSSADSDLPPPPADVTSATSPYHSDFEGVESIELSGDTVVLENSNRSPLGAWLLIPGESSNQVQIVRKDNVHGTVDGPVVNGASEISAIYSNESAPENIVEKASLQNEGVKKDDKAEKRIAISRDTTSLGNRSGSSGRKSEKSRCSAEVQTDTLAPSLASKGGSDVMRLLQEIQQMLISESRQRAGRASEVLSLDRKSQLSRATKTPRTDLIPSYNATSLRSSLKETLKDDKKVSKSSHRIHEADVFKLGNSSYDARASSTPMCTVSTGDDVSGIVKVSSTSSVTSLHDSVLVSASGSVKSSDSVVMETSNRSLGQKTPIRNQASVDMETQSEQNLMHQATQMSDRGIAKSTATQMGSTLRCQSCSCMPISLQSHADQGTQMSHRSCRECKKVSCICSPVVNKNSSNCACKYCKKSDCCCKKENHCLKCQNYPCQCQNNGDHPVSDAKLCLECENRSCKCQEKSARSLVADRNPNSCLTCKKAPCCCHSKSDRSSKNGLSSRQQLKVINGDVFGTYLDVDFSSSQTPISLSSESDETAGKARKKEGKLCSVCRCIASEKQSCVFCVCHIDKKTHIPRCNCHEKVPKYLIPGFCKCHKRNLRYFDKCLCSEQHEMLDNKCPCCQHFAATMRAKVLEAQLKGSLPSGKSVKPPPPPPKNYFLKLEETEISKDSTDVSGTERRPLEVVTIKIPVKRMGKAKVACKQFYYDGDGERSSGSKDKENEVEFLDDIIRKYAGIISNRRSEPQSGTSKGDYLDSNRKDGGVRSERRTSRSGSSYRTLQECLESNRPDFLNSAEYRRQVIQERARERELRHRGKLQKIKPAFTALPPPSLPTRIFTTSELREQTRKRCKQLSEVTQKKEERRKNELYRTNKIMAEIFAKKLQLKTLRGQLNISNSCNLLTT